MLQNMHILVIFIYFLLLQLCSSLQDVSVDGMSVTIIDEENEKFIFTFKTIGSGLGYVIGFNFYLYFSSASWVTDHIYTTTIAPINP